MTSTTVYTSSHRIRGQLVTQQQQLTDTYGISEQASGERWPMTVSVCDSSVSNDQGFEILEDK